MKFRSINSIRIKLTLWYGLVVSLIFLISGILFYSSIKKSLLNELDKVLFDTVHEVEHSLTNNSEVKWSQIAQKSGEKFQLSPPFVQIIEVTSLSPLNFRLVARSRTLVESRINLPVRSSDVKSILSTKRTSLIKESVELSEYNLRILYYPVFRENLNTYIILSAASMSGMLRTFQQLFIALLILGPLILFLISAGGYFIINRAMRPVQAVVSTARKISAEDLSHRIDVKDCSSEIGELIETFNQMIARLEGYVNHIKRFTSNVSHELRTPLTVIRGEVEVTLRKARKTPEYKKVMLSVLEESIRLEQIINGLLVISRLEAQNKTIPLEEISMDKLLLRVFGEWELKAKNNGLHMTMERLDPLTIPGNEILLNSLMFNLMDNIMKFTPESGEVEISLEKKGDYGVLSVKDTGIGIPEESLPHIFERFYRVDKARSRQEGGSGLGLAIVKHVAEIHGATINVSSRINEGSLFTFIFPLYNLKNNPEH